MAGGGPVPLSVLSRPGVPCRVRVGVRRSATARRSGPTPWLVLRKIVWRTTIFLLECGGPNREAIAHFQKALEIKPDYAEARYNLAVVLANRRQIDSAITHYQKALEIKPDFAEAHYALAIPG